MKKKEIKKSDYYTDSNHQKEFKVLKEDLKVNLKSKSVDIDNYNVIDRNNQINNVRDFFELLYPDNVKGEIGIWTSKKDKTRFFNVKDKDKVEEHVITLINQHKDVYYNVSLQNLNMAKKRRMENKKVKRKVIEDSFKELFFNEYKKSVLAEFEFEEEKEKLESKGLRMSKERESEYKSKILTLKEKSEMIKRLGKESKEVVKKYYDKQIAYTRGSSYTTESNFGIWLDIDIDIKGHHKNNSKNNFKTFEEAFKFIMSLDIKPTLIVKSGGGFHVYYVLDKVVTYKNDDERMEFEDLVKKVILSIRERAKEVNGEGSIDTVFDLARLLRIPFTYNFKDKNDPKPVEVVYYSKIKYTIKDLERLVIDGIEVKKNRKVRKETSSNTKGFKMKLSDGTVKTFTNEYSGNTLADAELMYKKCAFIKYCVDNPDSINYKEWLAMLQTVYHCKDGRDYIHEWSKGDEARYDEYEVDMMIDSVEYLNPVTHDYIVNELGFEGCEEKGCSKFHSPITLAYKK